MTAVDTAAADTRTAWHSLDGDTVATRLDTNPEVGLAAGQARLRLEQHGPNRIDTEPGDRWWTVLARQFIDALIAILVVAAAVAAAVGEMVDAVTILAIVILNGVLGFVQEWRAERALESLQQMLAPRCRVIRDGHPTDIDAADLVPGDLVVLDTGDHVPADLRLVDNVNLSADESALTGESVPVAKVDGPVERGQPLAERSSMLWMGTSVTSGHGTGLVVSTGMNTEFGRIAELTRSVGRDTTPLQHKLALLGRQLGLAAIVISVVVAATGWLLGKSPLDMFLTAVSLAVAVVPEGLPAVVTITLALGVRSMVKRKALVRRLQVAEALGSATVICTDKTGTLTENQMTVTRIWTASAELTVSGTGYEPTGGFTRDGVETEPPTDVCHLVQTGAVCNNAQLTWDGTRWIPVGDPTEAALVVAGLKAGVARDPGIDVVAEMSFTPERKMMTVVESTDGERIAHVKGAPEMVLERCSRILTEGEQAPLTSDRRAAVDAAFQAMASDGLRTLALARREVRPGDDPETDLTLLGIVGIIDPPRPEVARALRLASAAGIRTIMITGDAADTARAVAGRVGLDVHRIVTGPEIDTLSDTDLAAILDTRVAFARTAPEHKLRLVRLLQAGGELVAMTGDGVNDAPALRQAEIGVAMGIRGTDVAKAAADMVLVDDNYASIVGAVEEGRRQYDNIQKFVRYLLSSNVGEVVAVFLGIVIGGPLILLPVQILWMNVITDGVTALALGVEPAAPDLMRQRPRGAREPILNRQAIRLIGILGGYIGLATLVLFLLGEGPLEYDADRARTLAFVGIVMLEKANVFNFRSLRQPIQAIGWRSNPWLLTAWVGAVALQIAAVYVPVLQRALHTVPLSLGDWLLVAAVALPVFVVTESSKVWRTRGEETS